MYKKIRTLYSEIEKDIHHKYIPLQLIMMYDNMLPIVRDDIKIVISSLKEDMIITFEATKLSNEEAKRNKNVAIQIPIMQTVEKTVNIKLMIL